MVLIRKFVISFEASNEPAHVNKGTYRLCMKVHIAYANSEGSG